MLISDLGRYLKALLNATGTDWAWEDLAHVDRMERRIEDLEKQVKSLQATVDCLSRQAARQTIEKVQKEGGWD